MATGYWQAVVAADHEVPRDRRLDDLTAELTAMLGSPDPEMRDRIALPTLCVWIGRGVYDDLLTGLGDGMATGLTVGLGERGTDSVFRRSFSVLVLAECLERDRQRLLLSPATVLDWGDRITTWLVREQDLRGYVPGSGWAHAVAHGADALAALARSPQLGALELTVLLDVLADRLLLPGGPFVAGELDRLAMAAMDTLRRDLVPMSVVEPWVARLGAAGVLPPEPDGDPYPARANADGFLRALQLQLLLAPQPPAERSDLLLEVTEALRTANAPFLAPPPGDGAR